MREEKQKEKIGSVIRMNGYVTLYQWLYGRTSNELEDILGFGRNYLGNGYHIYFLIEPIRNINEFIWKGTTMNSDGWVIDDDCKEFIQISDQYRSNLAISAPSHLNHYDYADAKFDRSMEKNLQKLNVREGSDRIVRICGPEGAATTYPDSPHNNVPQWRLLVKKNFRCVAYVPPGKIWLGGAQG